MSRVVEGRMAPAARKLESLTEPVECQARLGWGFGAFAAGLYAVCAAVGTYPGWTRPRDAVPGILGDQLQHLWLMRWYRTCLVEARNPLICPEMEFPVGTPLGDFSPMHLQSVLYVMLSAFVGNDVLQVELEDAGLLRRQAEGLVDP